MHYLYIFLNWKTTGDLLVSFQLLLVVVMLPLSSACISYMTHIQCLEYQCQNIARQTQTASASSTVVRVLLKLLFTGMSFSPKHVALGFKFGMKPSDSRLLGFFVFAEL